MIFICPSCGVRLEKDFKFCPNCGFDLSSPSESEDTGNDNGHSKPGIVICSSCGEENKAGNDFCTSCGAKLPSSGKKTPSSVSEPQKRSQPVKKKPVPVKPGSAASKNLAPKQIVTIIIVVAAILAVILAASGVFDGPVPVTTVTNQQPAAPQNQNTVDMSLLNDINVLEQKVKANSGDMESLLSLAHLKNDAGLPDKAIENYRQYLEKKPSDADARVDMGVCYYNLKNYDIAIAEMKKALEYKPKHQIAHLNLGIVNLTAGNLEESKNWFKKAVEIDPNSEVGKRAQELLKSH
jgi:uncharacterized membrane protein YvbJ